MITTNDLEAVEDIIKDTKQSDEKTHPWRICPIGKHFVKKHIVHIPPSKNIRMVKLLRDMNIAP